MRHKTQSFYNTFYRFYPLVDFFLASSKRKLAAEINQLPDGKILEIGVGNGSIFHLYQKHQIIGIDISKKMMEVAQNRASRLDIELILMNGEQMDFADESFDYVIINHVLSVTESADKMIDETQRVLKKGGLLFIQNHFTPSHWLKIVDYCFYPFSLLFKFKSIFRPEDIRALSQFKLIKSIPIDRFGYFTLLAYAK